MASQYRMLTPAFELPQLFYMPDHFEEDCFEWDLMVGNNFAYFARIILNNYRKIC